MPSKLQQATWVHWVNNTLQAYPSDHKFKTGQQYYLQSTWRRDDGAPKIKLDLISYRGATSDAIFKNPKLVFEIPKEEGRDGNKAIVKWKEKDGSIENSKQRTGDSGVGVKEITKRGQREVEKSKQKHVDGAGAGVGNASDQRYREAEKKQRHENGTGAAIVKDLVELVQEAVEKSKERHREKVKNLGKKAPFGYSHYSSYVPTDDTPTRPAKKNERKTAKLQNNCNCSSSNQPQPGYIQQPVQQPAYMDNSWPHTQLAPYQTHPSLAQYTYSAPAYPHSCTNNTVPSHTQNYNNNSNTSAPQMIYRAINPAMTATTTTICIERTGIVTWTYKN